MIRQNTKLSIKRFACLRFSILYSLFFILYSFNVSAYEYDADPFKFKLTGSGTSGIFEPDFEKPEFLYDWRIRGDMLYAVNGKRTLGLAYALDQIAIDQDRAARDAFIFFENRGYGRIEFGFTDSVVRKIGLGLPDVGGLRVNDQPLFYKEIQPHGPVISEPSLNSGRYAVRANVVTDPGAPIQYGVSFAGLTNNYKYAADAGLKYRASEGKTKTALSLGVSFIDAPDGYNADLYAPSVTADSRSQVYTGMNLQYNSWVFGMSARLIYDDNPIGQVTDGFVAGAGLSYDLLQYSVSGTYLISDTGVWHTGAEDYIAHSGILSFRYKYSELVDIWMSGGLTTGLPFVSAGLRVTF